MVIYQVKYVIDIYSVIFDQTSENEIFFLQLISNIDQTYWNYLYMKP